MEKVRNACSAKKSKHRKASVRFLSVAGRVGVVATIS